jgi:hypothetical protein
VRLIFELFGDGVGLVNISRRSYGIRQIAVFQDFGATEAFNENSFHRFTYAI